MNPYITGAVSKWETAKGYPEGSAETRFKMNGVKEIVFYCNRDGCRDFALQTM